MKRLAQFLRSVLPADLCQLAFLTGTIFLFISPRLPWRPSTEMLMSNAFPLTVKSDSVLRSVQLIFALLYPAAFAGLVAYFTCFYPGKKPTRRILTLVFLPAIFSLGSIFFVLSQIFRPPSSVFFQSQAYLSFSYQWLRSNGVDLPVGFWFCFLSLPVLAIFLVRLRSGATSLPLVLRGPVASVGEAADLWPKIQILIFILLAPLYLIVGFAGILPALPFSLPHVSLPFIYISVARVLGSVLESAIPVAIALWILGPWGRNAARKSLQVPEPRNALISFLLPILVAGLPQALHYLIDRTQWAIYLFNRDFPPQIIAYFDLGQFRDPWLLLMVFGAFAEEIVFRGMLLQNLIFRYGLHRGTFLTGIIWGAYHFRSDPYFGLSVGGVLLQLAERILICVALNCVLAWMTLRWESIIPAGITHTVSNILVVVGINKSIPWSGELRILEWAAIAFLLFRYWPLARTKPTDEFPPSVPVESALDTQ